MEQLLGESATTVIMSAFTLLVIGGLAMTQLNGGIMMWLLVSWVGIPAFVLLAGLLINTPQLLFGAAIMIGLYAFKPR